MNKTVSVPSRAFAWLLCLIAAMALLLGACQDTAENEGGTITFTIGDSPTERWAAGPNGPLDPAIKAKLTHVIELYNGSGYGTRIRTITLTPGNTSHTETNVPLGALRVEIRASLNGYDFAYGDTEITVASGKNSAPVTMERMTHCVALSVARGGVHTFPALTQGYTTADLTALTVTVTNYAENATGPLTVSSSNASFAVSPASIASIAQDGHNTFTVTPAASLAVGTYTATISVTGANGISASFTVSVSVTRTGTGTTADPFVVHDEATLRKIGTETAAGGWTLSASYEQTANITLTSAWTPIGNGTGTNLFSGSYDGGGYTISGLTINNPTGNYHGLFGAITGTGAIVKNVGIVNCEIKSGTYVGGVAGVVSTGCTVQNCYAMGNVSGSSYVGGVVGLSSGTVENCYAMANVSGTGNDIGGVVGGNQGGTVQNCYATGNVSGTGNVGGVVGGNQSTASVTTSTLRNCAALNPNISGSSTVGRVAVNIGTAIMTNNYGRSNMTVNEWATVSSTDANGIDGADVSASDYNSQTWWTTTSGLAWDFTTVWEWNSATNLPKLRGLGGQ